MEQHEYEHGPTGNCHSFGIADHRSLAISDHHPPRGYQKDSLQKEHHLGLVIGNSDTTPLPTSSTPTNTVIATCFSSQFAGLGNTSRNHQRPPSENAACNHKSQGIVSGPKKTMTATDVTGFDAIFSTEFFATFSRLEGLVLLNWT